MKKGVSKIQSIFRGSEFAVGSLSVTLPAQMLNLTCPVNPASSERTALLVPSGSFQLGLSAHIRILPLIESMPLKYVLKLRNCRRQPSPQKKHHFGNIHQQTRIDSTHNLPMLRVKIIILMTQRQE